MKLSLSTNWCNRRLESGEAIVDAALALGVDELELGFHTSQFQVEGFKRRLGEMPVGSVHAFCPVPISAPCGYPELYTLATKDENARALARFHVLKNIRFAADIGADTVVLHAGRVPFGTFFNRSFDSGALRAILLANGKDANAPRYRAKLAKAQAIRRKRGEEMLDVFRRELATILEETAGDGVVLALENLPYLEGFPDEIEMDRLAGEFAGAPLAAWYDTGHDRVRRCHGWIEDAVYPLPYRGMHLNDVVDLGDDHLPPGEGGVDFAALVPMMRRVSHVVLEPNSGIPPERLANGVEFVRKLTA